jgi:hypothetical protein
VEADGGQGDGSADEANGSTVKGGSAVEGGGSDSNGIAGGIASSTAVSPPLAADGLRLQPAAADRAGAGLTPGAVCPQHADGPPSPAVPATAAAAGPTGADQQATSGQTGDGPTGDGGSSAPAGPIGQRLPAPIIQRETSFTEPCTLSVNWFKTRIISCEGSNMIVKCHVLYRPHVV